MSASNCCGFEWFYADLFWQKNPHCGHPDQVKIFDKGQRKRQSYEQGSS